MSMRKTAGKLISIELAVVVLVIGLPSALYIIWHQGVSVNYMQSEAAPMMSPQQIPIQIPPPPPPRTIFITSPANGAIFSGTYMNTNVAISLSRSIGVVGVELEFDGRPYGTIDTKSPYVINFCGAAAPVPWACTVIAYGTHTFTAVAITPAVNPTSTPVTFTFR